MKTHTYLVRNFLFLVFLTTFSLASMESEGCNTSSTVQVNACDSFTSPSGKYTWYISGIYQDTIKNAAGCDSFMLIAVNINSLTAQHTQQRDSLLANIGADYYQWINCDQANTPIVNDTNRVFYPQGPGNYAVIVSLGACVDTSDCAFYNCNFGTSLNVNACEPYLSPSGRYVWNISGFYTDTITHPNGCKELFSISLTVNNQKPNVTQTGNDLIATGTGTIFQWISCDSFAIPWPADDTSSSFTPMTSGTYAVIVTTNGCADTSDCFQFNMVGLKPIDGNHIHVYPNPATETFYVESELPVKVSLYSPDGRRIREYPEGIKTRINTAGLAAGVYAIKAQDTEGLYTRSVVITH